MLIGGWPKSGGIMSGSVLLDTSFFIRLLNPADPIHTNARAYYKYFLDNKIELKISTISIAEYCIKGKLDELPLRNLRIVPFNIDHALKASEFARILFEQRNSMPLKPDRLLIPNDAKLFAQAHCDTTTKYYATADSASLSMVAQFQQTTKVDFAFLDIRIPCHTAFGELDFS
jgi:predicted nucleic acid-binding protein